MFVIEADGMLAAVLTPEEMVIWFNTITIANLPGVVVWYVETATGAAERVTHESL